MNYGNVYARRAGIAFAAAAILGALLWSLDVFDRAFIYFPSRAIESTPADVGLDYEDVAFHALDGVRLHGWRIPAPEAKATVVWFHGNAGNIGDRVGNIGELVRRVGVNVFIFDYRGYGRSEGSPSEQGTYVDAEAALDYIGSHPDVNADELVYFGRSMGCAVAVEMASRRPPLALICESGFTSVAAMAAKVYPFLPGINRLISTKYDTLEKIPRARAPVMIVHGDRDDIVPFDMGRALFAAAPEPKRFYTIEGADHNNGYIEGGAAYFEALRQFIEDAVRERAP